MEINVTELEKRLREQEAMSIRDYCDGKADAPLIYKTNGYALPKAPMASGNLAGPQIFVASEESEDRMGDVIHVDGWKLNQFKKNPVFMFQHNYALPPIGTVPKIWIDGRQLLNTVKWDDESELGAEIHGKFDRRIMRAESVGFRALNVQERNSKGLAGSYDFLEQELLEISAVSIPAHPAALRKAIDALGNPNKVYFLGEIPIPTEKGVAYQMMVADSLATLRKEHREDIEEDDVEEKEIAEETVEESGEEETAEETEEEESGEESSDEGQEETEEPSAVLTRTFSEDDVQKLLIATSMLQGVLSKDSEPQIQKQKEVNGSNVDGILSLEQLRQVREAISGVLIN
jgi:hypothetical protein